LGYSLSRNLAPSVSLTTLQAIPLEQVTFSGAYATKTKQPVLYITERAVFELLDGHLTLIEVAPGIDVQKDVLAHMDFVPQMAAKIELMPAEIFKPKWGGLKTLVESRIKPAVRAAA
jgi:propionate CoA-transferase